MLNASPLPKRHWKNSRTFGTSLHPAPCDQCRVNQKELLHAVEMHWHGIQRAFVSFLKCIGCLNHQINDLHFVIIGSSIS